MRATEFVFESIGNKKLRESIHKDLCHQISLLEKSFNREIEPGKDYIPVPIFIVSDHMDTFNKNYSKHCGEFCTLLKIKVNAFEFKTKSGEMVEWPNQQQIGISYMTTLIARDVNEYDKIRTMLALIFNFNLPPSSEEE